jgi:hypothetical protein
MAGVTRVKATEPFKTYYQMLMIDVAAGEEFEGPFAEFLLDGGSAVELLDSDPSEPSGGGVPAAGTVPDGGAKDVLAWVGDDPGRAREAADVEQARDKPRSTLLTDLAKIAGS